MVDLEDKELNEELKHLEEQELPTLEEIEGKNKELLKQEAEFKKNFLKKAKKGTKSKKKKTSKSKNNKN
jgi:hypothetical protein